MSSRMKGAFGKMKSSKMKFNMTKPGNSGKSTKQLKNMFNRFNKSKDDDQKWSSILSGSWEIEIPIGEFLNAPRPSSTDDSSQSTTENKNNQINDPNSVSSRQCPMIQIYENLKVISLPLPTDIANPHIHKKYLESKSIPKNSTRIRIKTENNRSNRDDKYKIHLVHFNKDLVLENEISNIILEGTINISNFTVRWSDGSSWTKQGVTIKEDEEMEISYADTPSTNKDCNIITNQEINSLRAQLEILKEKEKMAKSQTQATMGQFADLSNQYAKITEEKDILCSNYNDINSKYILLLSDYNGMKLEFDSKNIELETVKNNMVFKQQMEIQTKLTALKKENLSYSESIKLQQERILSLQDQLQTSHIATRQYTKTIEDLETKISIIGTEKQEIKQVLSEMNNKFVTSQTNLDDLKHKEMIINDKHNKNINILISKHEIEIEKLERGFQETLRQNEGKMQEMQTLRNSYEKKNASLTKDVKKLIIQLEKQANNTYNKSITLSKQINIKFNDNNLNINEEEIINKLKIENKQLTEELMRKSQSLVDALRALAEFNRNPVDITKVITQNLSHTKKYIYNKENNSIKYLEHKSNVNDDKSPQSISSQGSNIIIGAKYTINDINDLQAAIAANSNGAGAKQKFNRFKNKFNNKMKEQITKIQQKNLNEEIARRKSILNEEEILNELNAKNVIKESEKILITKTKQQLNKQCEELQGLANELSSTIEQKEVILESLRFANTYLGKRVIALEKLMNFKPGKEIKNQEQLIAAALNISPHTNDNDDDELSDYDEKENDSGNDNGNEEIVPQNENISDNNDNNDEQNQINEENDNINDGNNDEINEEKQEINEENDNVKMDDNINDKINEENEENDNVKMDDNEEINEEKEEINEENNEQIDSIKVDNNIKNDNIEMNDNNEENNEQEEHEDIMEENDNIETDNKQNEEIMEENNNNNIENDNNETND